MPPQSCTLRLKVMHGHGVANLERGEVLANLQRAIIGLTRLGMASNDPRICRSLS